MLIVYASKTGNVQRFVRKTGFQAVRISEALRVTVPFVLVTYTTGIGKVPSEVMSFLSRNHKYLQGVAASGNRNWGGLFGVSADIISQNYSVPVISKFEMSGTPAEVASFIQEVSKIESC
ncbi:class Ib ribonucleoside-diphosphate reductase assembly flavoprotein NrdI (plasmid) [Paenibacillus peoriae]|uniref:Protein NrdI n=1 Tax=Paenibacillus peoriae TaxID=59893 RepID=A0A7H0YH93_9BACL|nr:class Ib ribonucleoside-diphosphate reductase assembly flavoprotein NrdI [Paenibacillus peoriae]QNR70451.1 class Ib ribonucleoside-diphosphate reductase assembly flavoprotein NrdI [Paenibacillus peoriae]